MTMHFYRPAPSSTGDPFLPTAAGQRRASLYLTGVPWRRSGIRQSMDGDGILDTQTLHVCHICLHWGGLGVNVVGIYMAYMERLGV